MSGTGEGQTLGGYEILFRIGSGGMAEVFAGCARREGGFERLVAIKRILPALAQDDELASMFLDEARLAAAIDSPHVVTALDVGRARDGQLFLVMELVVGVSLDRVLSAAARAKREIPMPIVLELVAQAAAGLHAAHEARGASGRPLGIVHRDVSPSNLLVSADGRLRVGDFGIARATERLALTAVPRVKGKLSYASPEQIRAEAIDRRSDVYSLGVVALELLSGRRLFPRETHFSPERLRAIAPGEVVAAREGLPLDVGLAVARALLPEAAGRFETAEKFADALLAAARPGAERAGASALGRWLDAMVGPEIATLEGSIRAAMAGVRERDPTNVETPRSTLRAYGTSFVGRETDVEALRAMALGGDRLITLLGPGGVGKTRLATELGHALAGTLEGGVRFCDLAEARSAEDVCRAVARALGIVLLEGSDPLTSAAEIGEALARRPRTLLVLDNVEQVARDAPATIGRWLAAAPAITILATSRERLHLEGEALYELEPLALPERADDARGPEHVRAAVESSAAGRLFLDRASKVRRGFRLEPEDAAHVATIVRRLDGLPLAIELAASRVRTLSPAQLAAQIGERFRALSKGARDASPRQATLEAAIRWSWDLLGEDERAVFAACAVFRGGFDGEAAERVCAPEGREDEVDVAAILEQLVDKSLVRVLPATSSSAPTRYSTYESIREFAWRELERSGALANAMERHVAWALERAAAWERETRAAERVRAIHGDLENALAAFSWVAERRAGGDGAEELARLALAVEPLLVTRGPSALARQLLATAIERAGARGAAPTDPEIAVRARLGLARALTSAGRAGEAEGAVEAARAIAEAAGGGARAQRIAAVELALAELRYAEGHMRETVEACARALDAAEAAGDRRLAARASMRKGGAHVLLGETAEAERALGRALAAASELGDEQLEGRAEMAIADLHLDLGHTAAARHGASRALELAARVSDTALEAGALLTLGMLALEPEVSEGHREARARFERALQMTRDSGHFRAEGLVLAFLGAALEAEERLEDAARTLERAIDASRRGHNRLAEGLAHAFHGRVLATRAALEAGAPGAEARERAAERALDDAAEILEQIGDRVRSQVAHLARGHLELAQAARLAHEGRDVEAAELRRAARERAELARPSLRGAEPRAALSRLCLALDAHPAEAAAPAPPPTESSVPVLTVDRARRTLRTPEGAEVSLRTRGALWLVLDFLAARRLDAPGTAHDVDVLFGVGWPGERAQSRSAASRVYVAMSTLRGLGLRDVLVRRSDGYLLDPELPIAIEPRGPERS